MRSWYALRRTCPTRAFPWTCRPWVGPTTEPTTARHGFSHFDMKCSASSTFWRLDHAVTADRPFQHMTWAGRHRSPQADPRRPGLRSQGISAGPTLPGTCANVNARVADGVISMRITTRAQPGPPPHRHHQRPAATPPFSVTAHRLIAEAPTRGGTNGPRAPACPTTRGRPWRRARASSGARYGRVKGAHPIGVGDDPEPSSLRRLRRAAAATLRLQRYSNACATRQLRTDPAADRTRAACRARGGGHEYPFRPRYRSSSQRIAPLTRFDPAWVARVVALALPRPAARRRSRMRVRAYPGCASPPATASQRVVGEKRIDPRRG